MSYQALLFCPDEKTARTVTQVLGELDFSVVPCTEPFAAVKKLMGERFDAVVVDCDNEQNATLLFKSARNAPNNQAALAVAVVEGQAGVAKAFRIGANLVLTKPINVEQAKGTLRVARGLLRKNEGTKPVSSAATPTVKPSTPAPAKPVTPPANVTEMRPAAPVLSKTPVTPIQSPIQSPIQKPMSQPTAVASASIQVEDTSTADISVEAAEASGSSSQLANPAQSVAAKIIAASSSSTAQRQSSSGSAASAPAPAREVKSLPAVEEKPAVAVPEATHETAKLEATSTSDAALAAASGPAFTFGGAVEAAKPASSGSKTKLIIAFAVVVIAAAGYATWAKFGSPKTVSIVPAQRPAQAATSAPSMPVAPTVAVNTPPAVEISKPDAIVSDTVLPASSTKTVAHASKPIAAPESTKTVAAVDTENKNSAAVAESHPIVIKNDHPKAPSKTADAADAPALSVTAMSTSNAALPDLMGSTSVPTPVLQKMMVSQGVSRGLLVKEVQPVYPRTAIQMHVEGSVQMLATVTKNGDISAVKVLSGDKELGRAAVEAVKQWKYKPYLLNGEPVDIQTQITVNFKLPR